MNPLEHGKEELLELSNNPNRNNLEKFFLKRTSVWDYPVIDFGPATVGICNGLIAALKPHDAFYLLSDAGQMLLLETDPYKIEQALDMLSELVTASNTSELPPELETIFSQIESKVKLTHSGEGVWNYIKKHYRKT